MIQLPTSYQWLQGGELIIPFGYFSLGNVCVATYAFTDGDERLHYFNEMLQGRVLKC